MVSQPYSANVMEEQVIRGNSALIKCHIPAFVADFVFVKSWFDGTSMISSDENSKIFGRLNWTRMNDRTKWHMQVHDDGR